MSARESVFNRRFCNFLSIMEQPSHHIAVGKKGRGERGLVGWVTTEFSGEKGGGPQKFYSQIAPK